MRQPTDTWKDIYQALFHLLNQHPRKANGGKLSQFLLPNQGLQEKNKLKINPLISLLFTTRSTQLGPARNKDVTESHKVASREWAAA